MDDILELDFLKLKKNFKSTQKLTESQNPRKIMLKNVLGKMTSPFLGKDSKPIIIDLFLNKDINVKSLNEYGNTRMGTFENTVYSFTDLKKLKRTIYLIADCKRIEESYNEYCITGDKTKLSKEEMLAYLILIQTEKVNYTVQGQHTLKLDKPIKILMQDENLHNSGFGAAYKYYITEVITHY